MKHKHKNYFVYETALFVTRWVQFKIQPKEVWTKEWYTCFPETLGMSNYGWVLFAWSLWTYWRWSKSWMSGWQLFFLKYSRALSKNTHRKIRHLIRHLLRGALMLSLMVFFIFPLSLSFSSVAVICCPASCNAGISRRKAPRHTPRQPWCCCISYQHSHRQEHKQPTTQKQGTLFKKLHGLTFRVLFLIQWYLLNIYYVPATGLNCGFSREREASRISDVYV